MDNLTRNQRRKNMQSIKSKGSEIETALAKALWGRYLRFSKNSKDVFGKPDIVFKKLKIAVFVDGEFWHGKDWKKRKIKNITNKKYWVKKIEGNIKRDKLVTNKLRRDGWKVLRFWGNQIKKELSKCVDIIEWIVNENKRKNFN